MGFAANFIRFPAVQNFEDWLRFDKVTESLKVRTFFETKCSNMLRMQMYLQSKMLAGDNSVVLTLPLIVNETFTPVFTRSVSGNGKLACSPHHFYQVLFVS